MFSIILFCLIVFIASLFISLWKEGITFTITVILFASGINPFAVIAVGILIYLCLFIGEKVKYEYSDERTDRKGS